MKALVVDDQPNVRLLLSRILQRTVDCTIVEASNGLEALELLGRESVDVVLLDVLMPLMDGLETLEAIRRAPDLRHLPVIVLSAVRDESKVRQLVRQGISGYLAKPLRPLDVATRLREILSRLAAADRPSRPGSGAPADTTDLAAMPRILAARSELRPHMISATEQVFGMMLGIDVQAVTTDLRPAVGDDVVRLTLRLGREDCDLEFTLTAPRGMTERMTAQYLRGADVITDEEVASTLSEMATIIGTRLQSALRQRGDDVLLAEASVSRLSPAGLGDLSGMRVCYASSAQDLRFMTAVRAVPIVRASTSASQAPVGDRPNALRMMKMDSPAPMPPVDAEVLDMLASLQEPGEPDLVVELVTLFLRDTPERLRELTPPCPAAQIVRVAHAVKGSAGNLGASQLQQLASRLEQAAHRGEPAEDLRRLVEAVLAEYARVELHLRGVLADRAGSDPALQGH